MPVRLRSKLYANRLYKSGGTIILIPDKFTPWEYPEEFDKLKLTVHKWLVPKDEVVAATGDPTSEYLPFTTIVNQYIKTIGLDHERTSRTTRLYGRNVAYYI